MERSAVSPPSHVRKEQLWLLALWEGPLMSAFQAIREVIGEVRSSPISDIPARPELSPPRPLTANKIIGAMEGDYIVIQGRT